MRNKMLNVPSLEELQALLGGLGNIKMTVPWCGMDELVSFGLIPHVFGDGPTKAGYVPIFMKTKSQDFKWVGYDSINANRRLSLIQSDCTDPTHEECIRYRNIYYGPDNRGEGWDCRHHHFYKREWGFEKIPTKNAHNLKWVLDFALDTGLRISEICALKRKHVHLRHPQPHLLVVDGKKAKGEGRPVYFLGSTIDKWLEYQAQVFEKRFSHLPLEEQQEQAFLFSSKRKAWHRSTIHKNFCKLKEGVSDVVRDCITFHSLRHFYATNLWLKTRDMVFISQQLRHSNLQSTDTYVNLLPDVMSEKCRGL